MENDVYILISPSDDGDQEFRVALATESDLEDFEIESIYGVFEDSEIFYDRDEAHEYARDLAEEYELVEYKVKFINIGCAFDD